MPVALCPMPVSYACVLCPCPMPMSYACGLCPCPMPMPDAFAFAGCICLCLTRRRRRTVAQAMARPHGYCSAVIALQWPPQGVSAPYVHSAFIRVCQHLPVTNMLYLGEQANYGENPSTVFSVAFRGRTAQ